MLQRDLWGAFDYLAWYPDEWVHRSRYEPAAMKLRSRLAKAIGRLSLTRKELAEISDNYAAAVASGDFALDHDPKEAKQSFLPADLFDPKGNWVRFRDPAIDTAEQKHFQGSGGRAVHLTFLRLPDGRAATQKYLNEVSRRTGAEKQFPVGTIAALVRRAIVIGVSGRMQPAPITELVQIRIYRRIPEDPRANFHGDRGEQDVYEFVLDREKLFAGQHGLRAVTQDEPVVSFFRNEGDPFVAKSRKRLGIGETQMQSCIQCHQAPASTQCAACRRASTATSPRPTAPTRGTSTTKARSSTKPDDLTGASCRGCLSPIRAMGPKRSRAHCVQSRTPIRFQAEARSPSCPRGFLR